MAVESRVNQQQTIRDRPKIQKGYLINLGLVWDRPGFFLC